MCLYVNYKTPSIAEIDITCYKVYMFYNNQEYISPYRKAKMPPMDTLTITELDENNPVNKGFHSFMSVSDAKNDAFMLSVMYGGTRATVFRCIIPKGTKYYEGHTTFSSSKGINDGFEYIQVPCYCSEALIVKPRKELSSFILLKRKIRDIFIYLKLMIFK